MAVIYCKDKSYVKETEWVLVLPPPVLESYSSLSTPGEDLVRCFLIGEVSTFLSWLVKAIPKKTGHVC